MHCDLRDAIACTIPMRSWSEAVAKRLVQHLERAGFIIMKRPPPADLVRQSNADRPGAPLAEEKGGVPLQCLEPVSGASFLEC